MIVYPKFQKEVAAAIREHGIQFTRNPWDFDEGGEVLWKEIDRLYQHIDSFRDIWNDALHQSQAVEDARRLLQEYGIKVE